MKPENVNEAPSVGTAEAQPSSAPSSGSAAGCSKWEVWPLMMTVGFVAMADNNGMTELILRAITIAALTYSISHRLCRRQNISSKQ
jgi:hypothetical protein